MIPALHVIIPAGGAGTRLWPMSRAGRPKFLLDLTGSGRSLLQQTWDRLVPLVGASNVHVVTGVRHAEAVAAQLPGLGAAGLVCEPSPRDSMPAIGLATALVHREDPNAVVASFAADHAITSGPEFDDAVTQACVAAQAGYVCTIGISPTGPSTAFGYVEAGDSLGLTDAPAASVVTRFVEKPDAQTAESYLASGRFRWNAGMFVSRADVLLDHLGTQQPRLREGIDEIASAWGSVAQREVLERVWPTLTRIAIDHAIAEPVAAAGGIALVPGTFGWEDVGDFSALTSLAPGGAGTAVIGDTELVQLLDAAGVVVASGGRTVSVIGIDDVVVVDTEDALLVTTLGHAQRVKEAVDGWRARDREDLL